MLTNRGDQTKNHVVLHVEPLPNLTGSCARGAKPIGAFGLVQGSAYQCPTKRPIWLCLRSIASYYQSLPAAVLNTHTMITQSYFYSLIVAGLAYAAYLKADIRRCVGDQINTGDHTDPSRVATPCTLG